MATLYKDQNALSLQRRISDLQGQVTSAQSAGYGEGGKFAGQQIPGTVDSKTGQIVPGTPPPVMPSFVPQQSTTPNDPLAIFHSQILDMLKQAQSGRTSASQDVYNAQKTGIETEQKALTDPRFTRLLPSDIGQLARGEGSVYDSSIQAAKDRVSVLSDTINLLKTTYGEDFSKMLPVTPADEASMKLAFENGKELTAEEIKKYGKTWTADSYVKHAEALRGEKKLDTSVVEVGGRKVLINNQTGGAIKDLGSSEAGGGVKGPTSYQEWVLAGKPGTYADYLKESKVSDAQLIKNQENADAKKLNENEALTFYNQVNLILDNPKLGNAIGLSGLAALPYSQEQAIKTQIDQVRSAVELNSRAKLKGQGTITDREMEILAKAATALNAYSSDEATVQQLRNIRGVFANASGLPAIVELTNPKTKEKSGKIQATRENINQAIRDGLTYEYK